MLELFFAKRGYAMYTSTRAPLRRVCRHAYFVKPNASAGLSTAFLQPNAWTLPGAWSWLGAMPRHRIRVSRSPCQRGGAGGPRRVGSSCRAPVVGRPPAAPPPLPSAPSPFEPIFGKRERDDDERLKQPRPTMCICVLRYYTLHYFRYVIVSHHALLCSALL